MSAPVIDLDARRRALAAEERGPTLRISVDLVDGAPVLSLLVEGTDGSLSPPWTTRDIAKARSCFRRLLGALDTVAGEEPLRLVESGDGG
jgi:hypothetical protein